MADMTASLDRAVEAAWPEFASSMEMDDPRFADPGRKERLRKIIAAALPHLGVDREALRGLVAGWREAIGHDDFGCRELRARDMAVEKCADELDGIINVNQEP